MALNQAVPQISTTAQTMIQGRNAAQTWARSGLTAATIGFGAVAAESSRLRKAGEVHISFGCQTLRNPRRHAIEISEAPMSTIHGLMKFEIRNCGTANDTPHTRIAGQIAIMPRQPANAQISRNGT